ncbi:unnamed protein product [Gongylonema pulchrum]|uniref:WD_REPEATS_REGION domain-containing protein n=1 Tax=Gongylonema pulchrum TaxID=637853 RepID=A0A183D0M8_9BILA|nr:unnamed protein product [Gongylonema pulchrum]
MKKYSVLMEPKNTPFESVDPASLPVKRIWLYLVRQEHILPVFVRHIFASCDQQQTGSGLLAVSNTRELQEMDIGALLDDPENVKLSSWMFSRAELDDNDDYQLLIESGRQTATANFAYFFQVYKRQVNGIRRLDAHPTMPYYVSGSSDGSIRLWEWKVGQPLFTHRIAGQFAKVTKVLFSYNGSKFASVDSDGILCLWQATQGMQFKKPFFNQKCHSKLAADVRFLGATSSVLVTAGVSLADENIALWDTLMPQAKALIHSWTAHPEGATSVLYLSAHQV